MLKYRALILNIGENPNVMPNTRFTVLKKLLKRTGIGVLLTLTIIWAGLWLGSPALTRYVMSDVLEDYKLRLHDDSHVRVNLALLKVGVSDLQMLGANGAVLNIPLLELDLSFWRLLLMHVQVESLRVDGVEIEIIVDENRAVLAGFELPLNEEAVAEPAAAEVAEDKSPPSLSAGIANLTMTNTHFNIEYLGQHEKIVLSELAIESFSLDGQNLKGALSSSLKLANGTLDLVLDVNGKFDDLNLTLNTKIDQFELNLVNKHIAQEEFNIAGLLSLDFKSNINVSSSGLSLNSEHLVFGLDDIQFQDSLYKIQGSKFSMESAGLAINIPNEAPLSLTSEFEISLDELEVQNGQSLDSILALAAMSLSGGKFVLEGADIDTEVKALDFSGLVFSQKSFANAAADAATEKLAPLLKVASTNIANIRFQQSNASIESIGFSGVELSALIDSESQIQNLVAFPEPTASVEESAVEPVVDAEIATVEETLDQEEETEEDPISFAISSVALLDPAQITINDESIKPAFKKSLEITTLNLSGIDSSDLEALTHYEMNLQDNEFFRVSMSGDLQPFKEKVNLKAKVNISELSLPEISAYQMKYLSFGTHRGQLNTDLNLKIVESIMDGAVKVDINGAKFSNSDTVDAYSVLNQGAVPLNVALDLIKDKKGNISLKVPLSGDVEDPSFGMQYILGLVVKKAAMSQAKNYLMTTFVPYAKVVSVAMAAGSYALKVRFEDLQYAPAEVDVLAPQEEFLGQFMGLMENDSKLVVHVCPTATVAESEAAHGATDITDEQKAVLLDIASQRGNNFKRYVVDNSDIESSRLLVCAPSVDLRADAVPNIALSVQ